MRIAFITFEYPPSITSGSGVYASNLTRELANLGHEVHVITPRISGYRKELIEEGIFVHRLLFIHKPFLAAPSFWLSIRKEFSSLEKQVGGFDIVHSNSIHDISLSGKMLSSPRVTTVHHLTRSFLRITKPSLANRIKNLRGEIGVSPLLEQICIRRADQIIAVSKDTKQDIMKTYGIDESRIEVIYNGINPEGYTFSEEEKAELKANLGTNGRPIVLFVGRLEVRKGVDILLRALAQVIEEVKVNLVLVGSGDQEPYLNLALSLGVSDYVIFLGRVTEETLRLLYSSCDLFVLPSRLEGLGLVLLEAMAAGKPIVATKVGGIPEIVKSGQNGILVQSGDETQLAQAIIQLLDNSTLVSSISENNLRAIHTQYSWRKAAQETEKVYNILLNCKNSILDNQAITRE